MEKINTLKEKIQQLINNSVETNNHQKTLLNFLFKKLEEVKEPIPTKLFLESGEIEYSQAEEFLKKYGISKK